MNRSESLQQRDAEQRGASTLFPRREPVSPPPREDRIIRIGEQEAAEVFDALSTDCSLAIYRALCDEPMTTADVADAAGTSVQNAYYHLEKLEDADLVEVVDTWYSSRGAEMAVYAAAADRVIVDLVGTDRPIGE